MITEEIVKNAAQQGMPALESLFKNLSKEDALKGLGLLVILGITGTALKIVKEIVMGK